MLAGIHDRKSLGFQALLIVCLLLPISGRSEDKGSAKETPLRFGDPEVEWNGAVEAEAMPTPSPALPAVPDPLVEEALPKPSTDLSIGEQVHEIISSIPADADYSRQFSRLLQLGEEAIPALSQIFADSTLLWQSRWVAGMALGKIGGVKVFPALEAGLQDSLFLVRMASVTALGDSAEPQAAALIRKALNDKAMVVRSVAADALGKLRDRESTGELEKELWAKRNFLKGRGLWIRKHIVDALIEIRSESTVPSMVKLLKDSDPEMRQRACDALDVFVRENAPKRKNDQETCVSRWLSWNQRVR